MQIKQLEEELMHRFDSKTIDAFCSFSLGRIWKRNNDNRASSAFVLSIQKYFAFLINIEVIDWWMD